MRSCAIYVSEVPAEWKYDSSAGYIKDIIAVNLSRNLLNLKKRTHGEILLKLV